MRKLFMMLLFVSLLALPAMAEEADLSRAWLDAQYESLVPAGVDAQRTEEAYTLALSGDARALSLRITVEGDLRFGRYAQYVRTALLDPDTGDALGLDAVFSDADALQDFLNDYVGERVQGTLNTYLDADDLLPVPLENVYFDAYGATFHYPGERFQYFSGHAGAVQLQWYELRELLAIPEPEAALPLEPGVQIDDLLEAYGSLTEPDLVQGGEIYEFESPLLRGVQAIADDAGLVTALRYGRFSMQGAEPGMARDAAEALLGAPEVTTEITAEAAQLLRLEPGTRAVYPDYSLYYDAGGTLYLLETAL